MTASVTNHDGFPKDLKLVVGEPEAQPRAESFLTERSATANPTSSDDPAILFPPTPVDDDLTMDIAFLSMHQLQNDPGTKPTTAEGRASASACLEPSIVSGTTDLFEGDLGDDGKFGLEGHVRRLLFNFFF
jgi:hypothetical protein